MRGSFDIAKIEKAVVKGAALGVRESLEDLRGESIAETPIEEATLIRSAEVDMDGVHGTMSFDTPYARRQHEDKTLRHDSGRKAKFLEDPLNRNRERYVKHMGRRIGEAIK